MQALESQGKGINSPCLHSTVKVVDDKRNYYYYTTTILWISGLCPGQPGWAGSRRNSPTHTYRGHQSSLICFLHFLRSMASSLFNLHAWQSFFHNLSPKFSLVYHLAWWRKSLIWVIAVSLLVDWQKGHLCHKSLCLLCFSSRTAEGRNLREHQLIQVHLEEGF